MNKISIKSPADIADFVINNSNIIWDLSPEELVESTLKMKMGNLANNGALAIDTGKFTGRAPKDRFIVKDNITENNVDWGKINQPLKEENYQKVKYNLINYLKRIKTLLFINSFIL